MTLNDKWYVEHQYIFWSGGKDSTATIILAHQYNIPVEGIVYCQVWYDKERQIPANDIVQFNWIKNVAIPKIEAMGYKVTVLSSDDDFLTCFYHQVTTRTKNPNRIGKYVGFPMAGKCHILNRCKLAPIRKFKSTHKDLIEILGIASDEPDRLNGFGSNKRSLLAELGYSEQMAGELCEKNELLSPLYKTHSRDGCWFCPNARISHYSEFRKSYPYLWDELLDLGKTDNRVKEGFSYDKSIFDINKLVDLYDSQLSLFSKEQK